MAVQTQIQTRRGAAATWTSTNPTLAAGEIGFESDTNKFKIGTGSTAWVSLPYASNVSPLTTKGDLYTYSTDNARLAVGANGETLVADSSTSTGLRYQGNYAAGKNKIINGDFYINQRNFTSNTAHAAYNFDRWVQFNFSNSGTVTVTPQTFTPGAAPVAGYEGKTFVQVVTASQTLSTDYAMLVQNIEDVRTFAGQTMTVSFWAKAASGTPKIALALEQSFGSGGSPSSAVVSSAGTVTLSTSWARYSLTFAVPSISGKTIGTTANTSYLGVQLWVSGGATYGQAQSIGNQNNTFQIWGVQTEQGSVATAFQTATGTLQGELAACQRYYYRQTGPQTYSVFGLGSAYTTAGIYSHTTFPVTMRVRPTSLEYGNLVFSDGAGSVTITSLTLDPFVSGTGMGVLNSVVSGATQFRFYTLGANNNSAGFLAYSAEL